jgi:hypothetical protein
MPQLVAAAIKFKPKGCEYFQIMCGKRHCKVLEMMYKLGIEYEKKSVVQGFLTDDDQFVDRYDAARMAYHSGQLKSDTELWQKMKQTDEIYAYPLFSEDLW